MDISNRVFLAAEWTDDKGKNLVGGFVVEDAESFTLLSPKYGEVVIPDGTTIRRPHRPRSIVIGTIEHGRLVER